MEKGATISDCGTYRFRLWRIWDKTKPLCMFVMHNPSTADGMEDDPTIRRCIGFAKAWGYGGLYVGNLSPYRTTNPKVMLGVPIKVLCPVENIEHVKQMASMCFMHVFAYGNPIRKDLMPSYWDERWHCIKLTKDGNPSHPLYLKSGLQPTTFPFPGHQPIK